MNNVINEQLSTLLEEIELIGDNYQRADIRVKLINALSNLWLEQVGENVGKDSFKHDTKKEVAEVVEEPVKETKKETTKKNTKSKKKETKAVEEESAEVEDKPIEFDPIEPDVKEDAVTEEVVEEPKPIEIDLEPQENEPVVIECQDEEGNVYNLDITEAWNVVGDEEGSEERVELARNLTEYNLLPVYNTFNGKLDDCYNKMMLAYYMQQFTLEGINEFIESLTEGMFTDVYEFVNNENLDGLIANIEEAASEEE